LPLPPAPLLPPPTSTPDRYVNLEFTTCCYLILYIDICFECIYTIWNCRWVQFHQVDHEHIHARWDVTAFVFWKGNTSSFRGNAYLRVVLVDEEVVFLYSSSMNNVCFCISTVV
jgi:hypothetical protein